MHKINSGGVELIEKELTYAIIGCALHAYNEPGYGFDEQIYGRALDMVLVEKGLLVEREVPVYVKFRGVILGKYRVDRVAGETRPGSSHLRIVRRIRPIRMRSSRPFDRTSDRAGTARRTPRSADRPSRDPSRR
jgi:hypothetical protein